MSHGYKQSQKGVTTSTSNNEAQMTLTAADTTIFSNIRKNQDPNDDDEAEGNFERNADEGRVRLDNCLGGIRKQAEEARIE